MAQAKEPFDWTDREKLRRQAEKAVKRFKGEAGEAQEKKSEEPRKRR